MKRGYDTRRAAAHAMGISEVTYGQHENGTRPISKNAAERYARFFGSTIDYILTGRDRRGAGNVYVPVMGKVGAGAQVDMPTDYAGSEILDDIAINLAEASLLQIEGESMMPRYLPGEWLIVDRHPVSPEHLINQYAVVQVETDGRRLVKMLRKSANPGRYRLVSGNGTEEDNVALIAAWRIKGTIA